MKLPAGCLYIVALIVCVLAPGTGNSAPLTRQQLLDMKSAGVTEKVIIDAVVANGIAFPADANAIISLHKAGFSNALLDALTKAQSATSPSATTSNIPAQRQVSPTLANSAQPPLRAQVDPCVAWRQEYYRLENEDNAIAAACENIGKRRQNDAGFVNHCQAMNCSVHNRLMTFPNPNKCWNDQADPEPCDDKGYTPDPNLTFHTVTAITPEDSKYSCAELKVLSSVMEDNVGIMDRRIQRLTGDARTHSQMAQAASVIAPNATAAAAGLQMMSSSDSQQTSDMQQVRDSLQKRHDYLMQIYFQKRCDD